MKFAAIVATTFLLLPKTEFKIPEKNFYAYVVPGETVPPFSSYTTGDAERNSIGFTANYKKLNPPSLKDFLMKNQVRATGDTNKPGGTPECGYSNPNGPPQPLPDHIEFGNYNLQNPSGLHPGPCEAWCDDEIVIPFTSDCRTLFQKPIPYAKDKCVGKSRFTFYWLGTHFAPFQVYIGCAPLQGAVAGGAGSGKNTSAPVVSAKPMPIAPRPTPVRVNPNPNPNPNLNRNPKPVAPAPAPAPAPVSAPAPVRGNPATGADVKCNMNRNF
jgi:hypothetical protein